MEVNKKDSDLDPHPRPLLPVLRCLRGALRRRRHLLKNNRKSAEGQMEKQQRAQFNITPVWPTADVRGYVICQAR